METKISRLTADDVYLKLGFDNWVRVEALGFSGGIWVLWKEEVNIEILSSHPQFIHIEDIEHNGQSWYLSAVYDIPSLHLRRKLWSALLCTKIGVDGPWMMARDFNAMVDVEETTNPDHQGAHRNNDFKT